MLCRTRGDCAGSSAGGPGDVIIAAARDPTVSMRLFGAGFTDLVSVAPPGAQPNARIVSPAIFREAAGIYFSAPICETEALENLG